MPRKPKLIGTNHGVMFDQGAKAVGDPFAVEWIDGREDYGKRAWFTNHPFRVTGRAGLRPRHRRKPKRRGCNPALPCVSLV